MGVSKQESKELISRFAIGLRQPHKDTAISRPCKLLDGLEEFLLIIPDDVPPKGVAVPTKAFLKAMGVEEAAAWEQAAHNTARNAVVGEMGDIVLEMAKNSDVPGEAVDQLIETIGEIRKTDVLMVVTNDKNYYGAASILFCRDKMRQVAKDAGVKRWLVSPVSPHECILESVTPGIPLDELMEEMQGRVRIMQEVDAELGADNRLIDRVYYMEF